MFITFEGIDGSGKSTVASYVPKRLKGYPIVITSEPTHTPLGDMIRERILSGSDPVEVTFLFLADRASHSQEIKRHLQKGEIVICDRYHDSTIAYQGVLLSEILNGKDASGFLEGMWKFYPKPDATLLFIIDPEKAIERISSRKQKTSYEHIDFLARVQNEFIRIEKKEPDRFIRVDSDRPLKDLVNDVVEKIKTLISHR